MIDAWNLVWIIPVVGCVCFAAGAWLTSARDSPVPDPTPALVGQDYCAVCPFNPNDDDKEE